MPFHFFQVSFDFPSLPKAGFFKAKAHRGTPKGGKLSLLFFSNRMAFFMHFYVPFHIFKVLFHFASFPKAAFCKATAHIVTPKEEKRHFLFSLIEWHFFMHFYLPFHFFKIPFDFDFLPNAAFC